ncbi:MAG: SMC-Scp complex subunit ScpB [Pseudomonadota bacterium]
MTAIDDAAPEAGAMTDSAPHGEGEERDAPHALAKMSPREAQDALAARLGADGAPSSDDEPDPDLDDEAASDVADAPEDEADAPVYDAAQAAEHARLVEALLFAAREPLTASELAKRLPHGADVSGALAALTQRYESRGVVLQNAGGRYRFVTNPDVAYILEEERVEARKLSRAALETLAVIAYHQPCTRADIEDVRGVAVSKGSLDQLLEIGWIRLAGKRKDTPGRPALYATTPGFLGHFNLESVSDLPGMADLKAAGLLDANLPPDFSVPMPKPAGEDDDEAQSSDADDAPAPDFVQDFHGEAPENGGAADPDEDRQ